jgi:hypothetical protein
MNGIDIYTKFKKSISNYLALFKYIYIYINFFQILNIVLWMLILIKKIYIFIKKQNKSLINSKINNLEKRVNDLESR